MNKSSPGNGMIKVHAIGLLSCLAIISGSVYFAGSSVAKRRGVFISARHELSNTKDELNTAITRRGALTNKIQRLERLTAEQLDLVSVKRINARSAEIVSLAEESGIRIDSLQPLEMISDARVPVQPMELLGEADADDAVKFLIGLGVQMPDIHVQEIGLVSDSLESRRVRVVMRLYWFVDPADES